MVIREKKKNEWFNRRCEFQDWKEKKTWNKWKKKGGRNLWEKYKTRNEYVKIRREEKSSFERNILKHLKTNQNFSVDI